MYNKPTPNVLIYYDRYSGFPRCVRCGGLFDENNLNGNGIKSAMKHNGGYICRYCSQRTCLKCGITCKNKTTLREHKIEIHSYE